MESNERVIGASESLATRLDGEGWSRRRVIRLKPRILLVDDDADLRALLARILERSGFRVIQASDGMEAVERVAAARWRIANTFGAIVADIRMPGLSGLDVLTVLRCAGMEIPVVLMSAFVDREVEAEARVLGAAATFSKPLDIDALVTAVVTVVGRRRLREVA